jgi:hypothetical protein
MSYTRGGATPSILRPVTTIGDSKGLYHKTFCSPPRSTKSQPQNVAQIVRSTFAYQSLLPRGPPEGYPTTWGESGQAFAAIVGLNLFRALI